MKWMYLYWKICHLLIFMLFKNGLVMFFVKIIEINGVWWWLDPKILVFYSQLWNDM